MAQDDVALKVGADTTAAKKAFDDLRTAAGRAGADIDKALRPQSKGRFLPAGTGQEFADASRSAQGLGAQITGVGQAAASARAFIGGLVASLASVAAVTGFIRVADDVLTLQARLKLSTETAEEFARAQEALFEIAQRSRAPLQETVNLYSKIATATKGAGVGQETLLGVVETINQAVQLSGASAASAQAALVQLGQGIASGTLRGEELNSVLEQTPALASAIARGMGITTGELRKYGEQGKITGQAVIAALDSQRGAVAAQFAELPITVGGALTQVGNAITRVIGQFNKMTQATGGISSVLQGIAKYLSSDEFLDGMTEWVAIVSEAVGLFARDMRRSADVFAKETDNMINTGENAGDLIARYFRELPVTLITFVQVSVNNILGAFDRVVSYAQFVKENVAAIFTKDTQDAAFARFQARNKAIADNVETGVDAAFRERDAALEAARKAREEAAKRRAAARKDTENVGTGKINPAAGKADGFTGAVVDAFAIAREASARGIKEVESLYKAAEISAREFLDRRNALQVAAIDAEIAQEQRKLAEAVKARKQDAASSAATNIEKLKAERADLAATQGRNEAALFREQADARLQLEAQRLEQQGELEKAARIRLELQFRETLARLQKESDTAGIALVNAIINTDASRAKFNELRAQFDRVQQELQARLQATADQRAAGTLGGGQAETANAQARAQATGELQSLNVQFQELATRTNDPQIVAGAQAVTRALEQLRVEGLTGTDRAIFELQGQLVQLETNLQSNIAGAGLNSINTLFGDLASGSKTASEAIRDFARNFVTQLAQIAAQALATRAILALLGVPAGGGGGLNPISAFVNHAGGNAGTGPRRSVSAWTFAGAPRLHNGMKADEFPAILQSGEEVLSRNDPKNSANGGGGVRVINVVDPNLVNDYMASASGERTIVNTIQRNRGQIKQLLG